MPTNEEISKILKNFPLIRRFIFENIGEELLPDNKLLKALIKQHREMHYLEYFLQHKNTIEGADNLINKIIDASRSSKNKTDWNSQMAELGAFYLLKKRLDMNVTAYEKGSQTKTKRVDFTVIENNKEVLFEVKYRAGMAIQTEQQEIDQVIKEVMSSYNNKYSIKLSDIKNKDNPAGRPNYQHIRSHLNKSHIADIRKKLQEHLNMLERTQILQLQNRNSSSVPPIELCIGNQRVAMEFLISIKPFQDLSQDTQHYINPDEIDDIKCWIFGDDETFVPMMPMVEEATIVKNADYLMCCAPFEHPFFENIKRLFSDYQGNVNDEHYARSSDITLRSLCGIIVYAFYGPFENNDYVIIENSNKKQKIKFENH